MTIHNRNMNDRLMAAESCAERTPDNVHVLAKEAVQIVSDAGQALLHLARSVGIDVCNADGLRNVEVAIYTWLRERNEGVFVAAETAGRLGPRAFRPDSITQH